MMKETEEKHDRCRITLWRSFIPPDMSYCDQPAVGDWEDTPVCEEHLKMHPDAKRWEKGVK